VNDVDGGPPGPHGPPFPISANIQLDSMSIPACTSAECKTGTAAFNFAPPDKGIKEYTVPNFGEDKEILAVKQHLNAAEAKYGKWDLKKNDKPDHPINYKVPNFGMDQDIADSFASESSTSTQLGHKWEPRQDANGYWVTPQPFDNRSYSYN